MASPPLPHYDLTWPSCSRVSQRETPGSANSSLIWRHQSSHGLNRRLWFLTLQSQMPVKGKCYYSFHVDRFSSYCYFSFVDRNLQVNQSTCSEKKKTCGRVLNTIIVGREVDTTYRCIHFLLT